NEAWMALAEETGTEPHLVGPGVNYFQVCRAGGALGDAREALRGIRAVLSGKLQSFSMDYSCLTPSGRAHFRMGVTPIQWQDARVVISHTDITALQHSKEQNVRRLRHLIRRLVNAQEEERQRIAREIHDDLGNRIALLAFSVRRIMNHRSKSGVRMRELSQLIDGITDLSRAMRNLTHCLHPPLLKHSGICAALQALCEEFSKTQGIEIDVVVPAEPRAI